MIIQQHEIINLAVNDPSAVTDGFIGSFGQHLANGVTVFADYGYDFLNSETDRNNFLQFLVDLKQFNNIDEAIENFNAILKNFFGLDMGTMEFTNPKNMYCIVGYVSFTYETMTLYYDREGLFPDWEIENEDIEKWIMQGIQYPHPPKKFYWQNSVAPYFFDPETTYTDEAILWTITVKRMISVGFKPVLKDIIFWEEKIYPNPYEDFYGVVRNVSTGSGTIKLTYEIIYEKRKPFEILDLNHDLNPENLELNLDIIKPIYGSNVSFSSRLNYLQTSNNSLKLLPSSENNLVTKFNFKYLLKDNELTFLLNKIENAEGYKNLEFSDSNNIYKNIIGVVEQYNTNKLNNKINELDISISSYFKAPIFNWKTSSFLNLPDTLEYSSSKNYKKYEFVYFDPKILNPTLDGEKNKSDNFWFAKEDIIATNNQKFDTTKWTKIFNHDSKLPFNLDNKYDFYQLDYKNSFIQNINDKENANSLKKFEFKIENITDIQCKSILFFLEKKCGYRRFVYKFPFVFSKYLIFVCTEWNHTFKYQDSNDITATFVEDPHVNSNFFKFIDYDFYTLNRIANPYPQLLTSL